MDARVTARTVELFHEGERAAVHVRGRLRGRHITLPEHMPQAHRRHAEWTTGGLPAYKHLGERRPHLAVNYSQREYTRTDEVFGLRAHVNKVESFNGTMRRAIVGVFHSVSVKHLGRYASEAAYRWNHRKDAVMDRLATMVRNCAGRVLSYAFLTTRAA